jgi:hypothetical protein
MGLVTSEFFGPYMDSLHNEAEKPMECYKGVDLLMKASYLTRLFFKMNLKMTGN